MHDATASSPAAGRFYLPDLCSIQALLPLILTGELLAMVLALSHSSLPDFAWPQFSLLSMEILWIVLCSAGLLCRLRPYLHQLPGSRGVLLCFSVVVAVTGLVATIGQLLLRHFADGYLPSLWLPLQHMLAGAIITGLVFHYYYLQQQLFVQQQLQLQARFQALQARIRPHFLFNSMNIIASLIAVDPDTAEEVVEDLSELFRASLSDADDLVPLAHEIDLCRRYVHIEQLRLGERLQVDWQIALHSDQHPVPSLSLQPLLENAIYHGIQPRIDGGTITIVIRDEQQRLSISISNPCSEETANLRDNSALVEGSPTMTRGNRMALQNLEQRLQTRYGDGAQFEVIRPAGPSGEATFTVNFSIPCNGQP